MIARGRIELCRDVRALPIRFSPSQAVSGSMILKRMVRADCKRDGSEQNDCASETYTNLTVFNFPSAHMPEHLHQHTKGRGYERSGIMRIEPHDSKETERAEHELPDKKARAPVQQHPWKSQERDEKGG